MSLPLLKPIDIRKRKPFRTGRFFIRKFGGRLWADTFLLRLDRFKRIVNEESIECWYKEFDMPTANDMHFVIDKEIPAHVHPKERELILKGARMAMAHIEEVIKAV